MHRVPAMRGYAVRNIALAGEEPRFRLEYRMKMQRINPGGVLGHPGFRNSGHVSRHGDSRATRNCPNRQFNHGHTRVLDTFAYLISITTEMPEFNADAR